MSVQAMPAVLVPNTQITAITAATAQSLYTVPSTYSNPSGSISNATVDGVIIQEVNVVNYDTAAAHVVSVYDVPSAGSPGSANLLCLIPVAAGRGVNPGFSTVIPVGHSLQFIADTTSVCNVKVSGSVVIG